MKQQLLCSIKKDFMEYMRTKKVVFFNFTLFFLCAIFFGLTNFFPSIIEILLESASNIISDTETIESTFSALFPSDLKANMGVLSSDMIIIYGIVVILSTYNLITKEIRTGKWIFPLSVGYTPFALIFSKGVVYGLGAAFPSFVLYNLYYLVGRMNLSCNYTLSSAVTNSFILSFAIFSIIYITIILATIYKKPIMSASTMIPFIAIAPDVFSMFSFGRYFPTNILTYLYQSKSNLGEIAFPIISLVILEILLTAIAAKKARSIEVTR